MKYKLVLILSLLILFGCTHKEQVAPDNSIIDIENIYKNEVIKKSKYYPLSLNVFDNIDDELKYIELRFNYYLNKSTYYDYGTEYFSMACSLIDKIDSLNLHTLKADSLNDYNKIKQKWETEQKIEFRKIDSSNNIFPLNKHSFTGFIDLNTAYVEKARYVIKRIEELKKMKLANIK
ncbi:MAG: hypothetical protein A2046_02530 [Bacteroidetes bacterium GWA2_30_7]|nr:MAG: hypothetical protein A2046_02530 [Bacteroidetes bacterium GWA2_30_7]